MKEKYISLIGGSYGVFDVANSSLVYLLVVFVFIFSAIFTHKAWKRGIEVGFSKDIIKKVVRSRNERTI